MRIQKVLIHGLFGYFEHEISFNMDERITIIHGPNGVGKTTILKLIGDVFAKRFASLSTIPCKKLVFFFADQSSLELKPLNTNGEGGHPNLEIKHNKKGSKPNPKIHVIKMKSAIKEFEEKIPTSIIEDLIPNLERTARRKWFDSTTNEELLLGDVILRYADRLPEPFLGPYSDTPNWLTDLLDSVTTHFINTHRLTARTVQLRSRHWSSHEQKESFRSSVVERHADEMTEKIQRLLQESGALAASLDRSFPQRLIQQSTLQNITVGKLQSDFQEQNAYWKRLVEAGLMDAEDQRQFLPSGFKEKHTEVLSLYLSDVRKKFEVFTDFLERVELFKSLISSMFLYKTFSVDRERGFVFESLNGQNVPPSALSSGEQHALVVTFGLIFNTKKNSLILIDEPELSLHVTWQQKFLENTKQISDLADLDFLIATHSPSIIHDRDDLMVALGEPSNEN